EAPALAPQLERLQRAQLRPDAARAVQALAPPPPPRRPQLAPAGAGLARVGLPGRMPTLGERVEVGRAEGQGDGGPTHPIQGFPQHVRSWHRSSVPRAHARMWPRHTFPDVSRFRPAMNAGKVSRAVRRAIECSIAFHNTTFV